MVGGKPYKSVSTFNNDGRFHLVRVDYDKPLQSDYLPATLTSKDYPNLIPEGETVDTIAVPAVLAAYNWAPNTERYRKLTLFVDAFFTKFPAFAEPALPSEVEGGLAAGAARRLDIACLSRSNGWMPTTMAPVARGRFDDFLRQNPAAAKGAQSGSRPRRAVQAIPGMAGRPVFQGKPQNARAQVVRPSKQQ